VIEYMRKYGFDKNFQAYYAQSGVYSMDLTVTDWAIERMIRDLIKETQELLEKNRDFLLELARVLHIKGSLLPAEVVEIAKKYGHDFIIKEESYLHLAGYEKMLLDN
jgi:hypothetical protein